MSNDVFGYVQKEVVAALPKLIKLNPVVVKEVFNRLLGVHSELDAVFCVDYDLYACVIHSKIVYFRCILIS